MSEAAIKKVRTEMTQTANNPYVQAVGTMLLQHIQSHPEDAQAVLTDGKTIAKSLEAMRKEAEKKKVGNWAVLSDAEGFAVVLNYFKSPEPVAKPAPAEAKEKKPSTKAEKPTPPKVDEPEPEDDIDFDSLLL